MRRVRWPIWGQKDEGANHIGMIWSAKPVPGS